MSQLRIFPTRLRIVPGAIGPGLLACLGVAILAEAAEGIEARLLGRAWIEALVLAILIGAAVRLGWCPAPRFRKGIGFGAKTLLEVAVVLLGATLSLGMIAAAGPGLLGGVVLVVAIAIVASYGLGRSLGLTHPMALLIACGNSICGNAAIASVAPVIGASGEDIAASISFTAVLGVAVVLVLPALGHALALTPQSYGIISGLTVYAVPQVLAATAPYSALSVPIGTLVKLMRVLMLGPVIMALSLGRLRRSVGHGEGIRSVPLGRLVPWFVPGFIGLMLVRSAGLVPDHALHAVTAAANLLTIVSMAGLGLETDLRAVARAGLRATSAVTLSIVLLGFIALGLIRWLGLA